MKHPEECSSIDDIREAIDKLDARIIQLVGIRSKYVSAAASFKKDTMSVKAADRVKQMLLKRREWAVDEQLDPTFIEELFTMMVDYFVKKEMMNWEMRKEGLK